MRNSETIEQQVNALTPEQQKKVLTVYRWDTQWCVLLSLGLSLAIFLLLFASPALSLVDPKITFGIFGFILIGVMLTVFVIFKLVIMLTVPYYNKHIARYILQNR